MKNFIIVVLVFFIVKCSMQNTVINITSTKEAVVDSCLKYFDEVPQLIHWRNEILENDTVYYYIHPLIKDGKLKKHFVFVTKPYTFISGKDSVIDGRKQYLTVIKEGDVW